MAEKFLDREGVKTLLQGINDAFALKTDVKNYDSDITNLNERFSDIEVTSNSQAQDIANLDGRVLSVAEIKELIKKTYDELAFGKYIVADKASVLNALSQIEESGSLVLEENLDMGNQVMSIPEGKSIVLDLGGKELNLNSSGNVGLIQVSGNLTVENGEINATKRAISVYSGGSVTIGEGAKIVAGDCAITANGAGSEIIMENGEVTAQEAGLLVTTGAKATVNGGKITGLDNSPIMGNGSKGQGDVEIVMNGGELIANIQSAGYVACGVYMPNSGSFTMNGGSIVANGGAGVVARGGVTTINGGSIITTAHPTLETGKVGDSRVVVPCSAIVYDKNSKYPAMDSLQVIIGANAQLQGAYEDISIISDEENPNIIDNREALPEE